ncbi:MAG TPA: hypothetical protein VGW12_04780 [Pyrinomonadaceae bacterium]|nr:hypothetical protein [Pyrinomonadaceae bacterium]
MRYLSALILLAILATSVLYLTGCNPRNTPIFRKMAEGQEKRSAEYTEEALKKSPSLQELDRLCTKEIPLFEGFVLLSKSASSHRSTFLSYFYDSGADYRKVKSFYIDYFAKNGWQLTEEKDGGWGQRKVEFRKGNYKIIVSHGGMENAEYAFDCEKLSDSGEALPNKAMQPAAK